MEIYLGDILRWREEVERWRGGEVEMEMKVEMEMEVAMDGVRSMHAEFHLHNPPIIHPSIRPSHLSIHRAP